MDDKKTSEQLKELWKSVLAEIEIELNPIMYKTYFANLKIEISDAKNSLNIFCPNRYIKEKVTSSNHRAIIQESINRLGKADYNLNFIIKDAVNTKNSVDKSPLFASTQKEKATNDTYQKTGLVKTYTFENYLMGKNNQLAYAIATAVANNPGKVYNPVFLYSGVGLGKTHLIQAIGNKIMEDRPNSNILYATGESFTNELIEAIQKGRGKTPEFRNKYRKLDLLLIDDIQFIAGKEATQEEFFHTFNALQMAQKQIVITSDKPPKDFVNIEARITSRFGSGIIADIQKPDTDMRTAILRSKRDSNNDNMSNEVIDFIAEKIDSNIRDLQGAYLQVLTQAKTLGVEITKEIASHILGQSINPEKQKPVNLNQIFKAVCNYYSVKGVDIKSKRRTKDLVIPRHIAMYLIKDLTNTPLMSIGEFLGGRDHTTVMHGIEKIENELTELPKTRQDILNIKQNISAA